MSILSSFVPVDAVDRADIDARFVLGTDAGLGDDIGHPNAKGLCGSPAACLPKKRELWVDQTAKRRASTARSAPRCVAIDC